MSLKASVAAGEKHFTIQSRLRRRSKSAIVTELDAATPSVIKARRNPNRVGARYLSFPGARWQMCAIKKGETTEAGCAKFAQGTAHIIFNVRELPESATRLQNEPGSPPQGDGLRRK